MPASTGEKHPDKEGDATGAERDTGGAPSLLAAGSPPRREARGDPRRRHPPEMRGKWGGGGDTNSPKSSQRPATATTS